jgi:NAD+ synthase (glutamine-hydrolysing)
MRTGLRLALCQINATVGDLAGNARRIDAGIDAAKRAGAELVLFPELALTGYPPEDLLLREHFLTDTGTQLERLASGVEGIVAIVGFPERGQVGLPINARGPASGSPGPVATVIHNSAAVLAGGTIETVYRKVHLPNYGVFDEQRYFKSGKGGMTVDLDALLGEDESKQRATNGDREIAAGRIGPERTILGLTVCEDLWVAGSPASEEASAGARLIVNISASPYHAGKGMERERLFAQRARETGAHIAFCAMVGGQDELVFDGHSFVLDATGETIARGAQFKEELLVCDLDLSQPVPPRARMGGPISNTTQTDASRARTGEPTSNVTQTDAPRARTGQPIPSTTQTDAPRARTGEPTSNVTQTDASRELMGEPIPSATQTDAPRARMGQPISNITQPERPAGRFTPTVTPSDAALRAPISSQEEEVYAALALGLHDYVEKNGFGAVVLGLSGGIDSALVACLAVDALGAERVNVAIMPSPYSSSATQNDARALARALGVRVHELSIEPAMDAYTQTLEADFEGRESDLTEENLQARIRGNLLMALSNKFGWLVLTTGNKSEMSVGYTTLYGDLAGGFAVIKDVPKTLVYRLAHWRNDPAAADALTKAGVASARSPIPPAIIERSPSAELRENQTDQDSLPPYEVLDRILHGYIELDRSREQLVAEGLPREDVERATRLVDLAEYKRRQAPPGIKITERAFGRDRRMPITNAYRG